ncbi:MAG: hypothetical protein H6757_04530 [Candidatus Omnitrophica bacterium]|nr:hypothetical protein [Candidatus Omnitrophota bacterium]
MSTRRALYVGCLFLFLFLSTFIPDSSAKYDAQKDNPYVQSTKQSWFSRKPKNPYMNSSGGYWKKKDEGVIKNTLNAIGSGFKKLIPG